MNPSSSTQHGTVIPPELISEVFSHVADDDISTLSACSQTSTWFRPGMQQRIFASVDLDYLLVEIEDPDSNSGSRFTLGDADGFTRSARFLAAITKNPRLAEYVNVFSFRINGIATLFLNYMNMARQCTRTSFSVLDILPCLTHLREFNFRAENHQPYPVALRMLCPTFQAVIAEVLQKSKDLKYLDISGFEGFPFDVLASASRLEQMTVMTLSASKNIGSPPAHVNVIAPSSLVLSYRRLHNSQLDTLLHMLKYHSGTFNFSRLKHLCIHRPTLSPALLASLLGFVRPDVLNSLSLLIPGDAMEPCFVPPHWNHAIPVQREPAELVSLQAFHGLKRLDFLTSTEVLATNVQRVSQEEQEDDSDDLTEELQHCVLTPFEWLGRVIRTLPVVDTNEGPQLCLDISCHVDVVSIDHIASVPLLHQEKASEAEGTSGS
ncbi:hypothetical protein CVT24_002119, partial [Panaeolus cyanescens]